ncbi:hypothetical protein L1987_55550 [Smallanthus sonchifolius]|uniref:Uncharacterized protein n=1 Tax=Smallanthus sonchifolius TaxID=185202 RepID=A0ACB9E9X2_9ASTR|nr:hypothetical protein L1987_55550 [Smallanthus sonchifolius]
MMDGGGAGGDNGKLWQQQPDRLGLNELLGLVCSLNYMDSWAKASISSKLLPSPLLAMGQRRLGLIESEDNVQDQKCGLFSRVHLLSCFFFLCSSSVWKFSIFGMIGSSSMFPYFSRSPHWLRVVNIRVMGARRVASLL